MRGVLEPFIHYLPVFNKFYTITQISFSKPSQRMLYVTNSVLIFGVNMVTSKTSYHWAANDYDNQTHSTIKTITKVENMMCQLRYCRLTSMTYWVL